MVAKRTGTLESKDYLQAIMGPNKDIMAEDGSYWRRINYLDYMDYTQGRE